MNRLLTATLFTTLSLAIVTAEAGCPTAANTVIEVCNDAGGNGTIRAYFYDGTPALSYVLFSLSPPGPVSFPLGPVTVNTAIPLPPGAVAAVEFGLVPNGDYSIRVNCSPAGSIFLGGLGINVNAANAMLVGSTIDTDCQPLTGVGNADGSISLNISGGVAPYDISWPVSVTPIANSAAPATGNYPFNNLDAGNYTVDVLDANNCVVSLNLLVPGATLPSAGANQTVCSTSATLNANAPAANETAIWTGPPGVTFSPNANAPNAVANSLPVGTTTLTWTITDTNAICPDHSDQVDVIRNPPSTIDAGPDQIICGGSSATLNGTVGGAATTGSWSGGAGTFSPNANTLNATYTPSAAEIAAGTVTLTLTTNDPDGAGPCMPITDTIIITINQAPTVSAGGDQTICADGAATLNGTVGGSASSATWSGGAGSFAPGNTTLNAVYTPGAAEILAGTVTLTLTTNDPDGAGPCLPVADNVIISINALATVSAGPDKAMCAQGTTTLNGTIGGSATSGTWSGGAGSFAPNNTTLNAVYTPSAAEVTAGTVTLTLTTGGPCAPVADNVIITINPIATVSAGADQTICANSAVSLSGSVGGSASTGSWSGGTGAFAPGNTTLNAVYTPSAGEITAGTVNLTLTTNDPDGAGPCAPVTDNITITINPAATINAGPDQTMCANGNVTLNGAVGGAAATGVWSGGAGIFAPSNATLNAVYTPTAAEVTAGSVTLTLTTNDPDGAGPCVPLTDNVVITINALAIVNAGADQAICANSSVTLNGMVGGSASSGTWSGGGGAFAPGSTTLNAVYTPAAAEIAAGTVTLTLTTNDPDGAGPCVPVTDNVIITINPAATVDAGANQTICANSPVSLNGTIGGAASTGTWSGGAGTFAPGNTTLNATYTATAGEIAAGTVTLILTTNDPDGAGPCVPVTDNVIITINPAATVNAGGDQVICANGTVTLSGSVGGSASSATWSGGTGAFAPNNTTLNAVYTPGAAEITAGTVTLTLTTNDPDGAGPCTAVSDNVAISINALATVNAGGDQAICAGGTATLSGTIGGSAISGTWSGGTGTFAPNNTVLNAVYTPSAAEITAGTVTLTLTTTGPCAPVADNVIIAINALATVNAGADQSICFSGSATLNGTIGGSATSGTWSGGGGTFAPGNTTLNAVYSPSAAEITAGTVTLTLTTAGPCAPVNDNVTISIVPAATANAGPDQTICANASATLNGTIGGSAVSGTWSGGAGTFAPNNTTLAAVYTPGAGEIIAGTVTLTLTTTGPCAAVTNDVIITINPVATVGAGPDQIICSGGTATLSGSVGGAATTGTWSGGAGTFAPDANTFNAVYTPSGAEVTAGTVTLTLTSNDPDGAGGCPAVSDNVTITITAAATVDAGPVQTICAGGTVQLAGSFTGSTGVTWSTSGNGSFNNNTLPNAIYTPGATDIGNGSVTLTLTTGGPCAAVNDNVVITIDLAPTVDAGAPQTVCATSPVSLNATFGGSATGLVWSTSGDGTFDDNTDVNAAYTTGTADKTSGSITLTATATGSCSGTSDNVIITLNPAAVVDAGSPQTVCLGSNVTLDGSLSGSATTVTWTTSGDGTFNNINNQDPVYTPGANDKLAGTVTLTATSNNPAGPCPAGSDNVLITLIPTPGDETSAGFETWIGYVYTDAGDPTAIPAKINFATTKYRGFITETDIAGMSPASSYNVVTDEFDLDLGIPLSIQGPNVCGSYQNDFSVRYKMDKTFTKGIYRFTVGGDDGVRLLIDGVNVLPASAFDFQSYTTYITSPICLSAGTHAIEIHYFDNTAQSRLTFNYQPVPTLTTNSPQAVCINSAAPTLTAGSTDVDVIDFNWYKGAALVFTGASYTPAAAALDMTTVATSIFQVRAVYACGESNPTDVTVDVLNSATLTINPATVCESGGIADLTTFVAEAPAGGAFTFAGHPNIAGNNFDPAGLAGNTIAITVDYSSGSCAAPQGTLNLTITSTASITVPAAPVVACESAPLLDLTTVVSAIPAGGAFSFSGTQVAGNTFDPAGLTGNQTITVDYSAGGCTAAQKTFVINVVPTASLTISNPNACENGGFVNLLTLVSATPSGGAFIFTGTTVAGNSFDPSGQSGPIDIDVDYNVNGCAANGTIQVTVLAATDPLCSGSGTCASVVIVPKPQPATCTNSDGTIIFSIKPFVPVVNNTGVKISITGISSTNLSISRTNFNDTIFNNIPKGTYDYSIEYGDPSCVKSGQVTVDQSGTVGTPVASNIISPVCFGSSTGAVTLNVPGETGNILEWSRDGGLTDPFKPFTVGGQITGLPAGIAPTFEQVISVRRNISDPCFASVTIVIPESQTNVSATFTIGAATCNGNDGAITNIVASGGNAGAYSFSIDGGLTFHPGLSFNGLAGGSYTLRVKDGSGCETDFPADVTFPGFINANITKQNATCSNDGNSGSISVAISDPGVFQLALSTDQFNEPAAGLYQAYSNPSVTFNNLSRGQYFVYLKSTTSGCPTRSAPIDMFGVYPITFDLAPDCNADELSLALLNVTGETGGAPLEIHVTKKLSIDPPEIIYRQFPADGLIYLDHAQHVFLNTPGEYQIKVFQFQNEAVCNFSSQTVDFIVPLPLFARIGFTEESYPDVPSGKLQVMGFVGGLNPYDVRIELDSAASFGLPAYETNFAEVGLNSNQNFEIIYKKIPAGRYNVEVMDSLGCSITLVARVPLDMDLFIPNVFTPNGDGSNDLFYIRNLPVAPSVNQLIISNRWGKEVFVSEDYRNNWDAEGVADGIYFYRLRLEDGDPLTGWVEILRGQKP